jgi:hypothetical protein
MGLKDESRFMNDHRMLSRAVWSALAVGGVLPTFSDALDVVRYELWRQLIFHVSCFTKHIAKLPWAVFNRFAIYLDGRRPIWNLPQIEL